MPIYEYRCEVCGHQEDHLQKVSEAPLTQCPACHKPAYKKQLSAAGFQLKGSGWYATDFKGPARKGADKSEKGADKGAEKGTEKGAEKSAGEAKPETKTDAKAEPKKESKAEAQA